MEKITVEIDAQWERRINSPLFLVVAALTGVSVTFAPLFLFELGQQGASGWNPLVWLCFAVIYLVPMFYMRLASSVIAQLYKGKKKKAAS